MYKGFLRWRHSKGFGVHSPYAYRFVTEVLRPGNYGYYAYREIEGTTREKEKNSLNFIRHVRFLIRLAIFLNIKRIIVNISCQEAELAARALNITYQIAETPEKTDFQSHDLLLIEGNFKNNEPANAGTLGDKSKKAEKLILKAKDHKIAIFTINPSKHLRDILQTPIRRGLLLHDKSRLLLIPREEMAYVSYSMTLKPRL
ncbi:MAG: hypothetical protein J1D77_02495 [Muribaculaceae bacterium]|nr:hypothetical protein [Muribaculaceae bacterium]